ncbi:hypothetical protein AMTR_s05009p00005040, partial [Amborella trichopoda]
MSLYRREPKRTSFSLEAKKTIPSQQVQSSIAKQAKQAKLRQSLPSSTAPFLKELINRIDPPIMVPKYLIGRWLSLMV